MIRNRFIRRYAEFTDQHGRAFGAEVEGETGHPCSPVRCLHRTPAGNLPPWLPQGKYLVFDPVKQGAVTIDYETAIADRRNAVERWDQRKNELAMLMAPTRAVEEIDNPSPALLTLLGPKPQGPELVEACQQGNKWALGLTDAMPSWAEPFMAIQGPVTQKPEVRLYPDADEEAEGPKPTGRRSHHKQVSRVPANAGISKSGQESDEAA